VKGPLRGRRDRSASPAFSPLPEGDAGSKGDEPCIHCRQNRVVKQFSLDPSVVRVGDGDVARPAAGVSDEVGEGEVTVVGAEGGTTHVLNSSAALIWLSLDGNATVADIVEDLHQETGVPRDVLAPDVRDAVARFVASGIAIIDR